MMPREVHYSPASRVNPDLNPFAGVDFNELEKSLRRPRTLVNVLLGGLVTCMTLLALIPLFSVVWMLLWRGGKNLSLALFTQLPPAPLEQGGGFGNAIVGTFIIVALAALISVPLGILSAVFMAQAPEGNRLASAVRFSAKVLTGFPSILAGVFAYGALVMVMGGYSAIAGAVAVSILMLPTIMLTAEDAIRMVPAKMKEAAIGMGATADSDDFNGAFAHGRSGDSNRRHAGRGARRGGDSPTPFYRSFQQLLADVPSPSQPDAAHGIPGSPHL